MQCNWLHFRQNVIFYLYILEQSRKYTDHYQIKWRIWNPEILIEINKMSILAYDISVKIYLPKWMYILSTDFVLKIVSLQWWVVLWELQIGHVGWGLLLVLLPWYPIMQSSLWDSFEDRAPVDFIYGCPIFKSVAVTWFEDKALWE